MKKTLTAIFLSTVFGGMLQAQTTDYIYGLHNTGSGFNLVEFAITDPTGTPSITTSTTLAGLQNYISGYGSTGRFNEYINGLAINPVNNHVYFNYTYNNTSNQASGNYTFLLYHAVYDTIAEAWSVSNLGGFSGGIGTSASAWTAGSGSGAFPGAAYMTDVTTGVDAYYFKGQNNDRLFRTYINPSTGGLGNVSTVLDNTTTWDDFDGGLPMIDNLGGGDFVIDNRRIYMATSYLNTNDGLLDNGYIRKDLSVSGSPTGTGASFNIEGSIPEATHGPVQVAGLGDVDNLYLLSSDTLNFYRVANPDAPSALGITLLGNVSGNLVAGSIADLSTGLSTPLVPIPEPSSALLVGICGLLVMLRRRRSPD